MPNAPAMPHLPRPPALLVGGVRSGCGKTTLTLALLAALRLRNIVVQACKAGPDFIDPAHHAAFTGQPSYNLDAWMGGADGLERAFAAALNRLNATPAPASLLTPACTPTNRAVQKMLLIEGVMGLFDGAASSRLTGEGEGSTAEIARRCGVPVLLVVDVRGMAQSAAAIVQGFVRYRPDISFAGIVCTHVGGTRHQHLLREALAPCEVPLLGLLPRANAPHLPSRHLGLLLPHEIELHAAPLADWLEKHMDIDALLDLLLRNPCAATATQEHHATDEYATRQPCATASLAALSPISLSTHAPARKTARQGTQARIAIAHDEAFCFLYPDFSAVLQQLGASTVFFSPLHDVALPPCEAVYLPGGYPELFAERLAANTAMREAIHAFADKGGTIYGECGGYMYMMESITTDTGVWPMTACLPLACRLENKRVALGYRCARPVGPQFWGSGDLYVRGHEYHYARLLPQHTPLPPLWRVSDAAGNPLPDEGSLLGRLAGSWLHLYPQGARPLLASFIKGLHP